MSSGPYSIGSDRWPGLSKLIEEAGEVLQVAGKLIAINGNAKHWDGSDLHARIVEEVADLTAACTFFAQENFGDRWQQHCDRVDAKVAQFRRWHSEHSPHQRRVSEAPINPPEEP